MGDSTFLGLREAVKKSLEVEGSQVLMQPQRLVAYLRDLADQSQPEVRMLVHQLDEALLAPLVEAAEANSKPALNTAQARISDILENDRFVNKQMAYASSGALVGGVADYLGIPFEQVKPPAQEALSQPHSPTPPTPEPTQPQNVMPVGGIPPTGPALPDNTVVTPQPVAPQPVYQPPAAVPVQPSRRHLIIIPLVAVIAILIVALIVVLPMLHNGGNTSSNSSAATTSSSVTIGSSSSSSSSEVVDNPSHPLSGVSGSIGNLINGGHMAEDADSMLYCAVPQDGTNWDTKSLVHCSTSGSNMSTIYTAPSSTKNLYHINAVGGKLVFNQVIEKSSTVECIESDGSGHITLDSCDDWSLCQVDDGWVYYLKSGNVCRCDVDGNSKQTLAKVGGKVLWRVLGKQLYTFTEEGASSVYIADLKGTNRRTAYKASSGHTIKNVIPVDEDSFCVLETGSDMRVLLVNANDGTASDLYTAEKDRIQRFCVFDGGVIITWKESDTSTRFIVVGFDGSTIADWFDRDGLARYTAYIDGGICYGLVTGNDQCSVRWCSLDGNTRQTVID